MAAKFSERMGKSKPRRTLQVDSMDKELRNCLWNTLLDVYGQRDAPGWPNLLRALAANLFKERVDDMPTLNDFAQSEIKNRFFDGKWHEVYDLIEYALQLYVYYYTNTCDGPTRYHLESPSDTFSRFNRILEREMSGYRFINGVLTPITDKAEVQEIAEAIQTADTLGLGGARQHLESALRCLGQKPTPDYRNSIKEAISAVESVAKKIAGKDSGKLAEALDILAQQTGMHGALKSAFSKLYGYTSDEDGIRHAILNEPDVGFAEAKFMVVSCSAFVNYVITKAGEAGLL